MKKIYKLVIMYDTEDEDCCESLYETVDVIEDEQLTEEDYANEDIRAVLIDTQMMGDA